MKFSFNVLKYCIQKHEPFRFSRSISIGFLKPKISKIGISCPFRLMCDVKEGDGERHFKYRVNSIEEKAKAGEEIYPHKFCVTISAPDFISQYNYLEKGKEENVRVSLAGRVWSVRVMSKKLFFIDIVSEWQKVQVLANLKNYGNQDNFKDLKNISRGDIIGVNGIPKRTPAGELSVLASEIKILTPCLRLMPSTLDKVKNQETKYRKRYLDLIFNEESRKKHLLRSRIILFIRNFLNHRQFTEVETPILSSSVGGAVAEPFTTRHQALGLDLHLRISPELYLKMLVIGGIEKVFEIGKLFRNEGEDLTHNPEFTALELYQAYADYKDMIELTETVLSLLVDDLFKDQTIEYDSENITRKIDFSPPYKKIDFLQSLEDALNVSLPPATELHLKESKSFLYDLCMKHNLQVKPSTTVAKLLDKLCSQFVESELINPTFIINHPVIMSPLAKGHRSKPGLTERFELFITTKEICNGYTELNDPAEQRRRFQEQLRNKELNNSEVPVCDENFCTALEYGLPPTGGLGIGIDRLAMILTNSTNMKDVILFPVLRPK